MKLSEETYGLIDQYLRGDLSGAELQSFEQEMAANADLANEIQLQKSINDTIVMGHMGQLLEKVDVDFDSHYDKTGKSSTTKKYLLGGLGLLSIAVIGYVYLNNTSNSALQKITPTIVSETKDKSTEVVVMPDSIPSQLDKPIQRNKISTPQGNKEEVVETKELASLEVLSEGTMPTITSSSKEDINSVSTNDNKESVSVKSTTTPKKESQKEGKEEVICPETKQTITYTSKNPSLDKDNGQLTISGSFKGLGENVRYRITDNEYFINGKAFYDLLPGEYQIEAQDERSCNVISDRIISLKKSGCSSNENAIFSMAYGQEWTMAIDDSRDASLVVKNASGQVVFEQDLFGEREVSWNGYSESGTEVTKGLYYYQLTYSDKEECIGVITLAK